MEHFKVVCEEFRPERQNKAFLHTEYKVRLIGIVLFLNYWSTPICVDLFMHTNYIVWLNAYCGLINYTLLYTRTYLVE